MAKIKFIKMHGLGNDYIYVDADKYQIDDPAACSIAWSPRHKGIGADGLVLYSKDKSGMYQMRIFNADGSEALMCGNAIRCVGKILYERGFINTDKIDILTLSGVKHLSLEIVDHRVESVTVDMNPPTLIPEIAEVDVEAATLKGMGVGIGNPHWVTFLSNEAELDTYPLTEVGPQVEYHSHFPDRTNFEVAVPLSTHDLKIRIWERGSGITMACGTGACASAVAAISQGLVESPVVVHMPGGELTIEWDGNPTSPVMMTGEATYVFDGEFFTPHVSLR